MLKCAAAAFVLPFAVALPQAAAAQSRVEFQITGGPLRDALAYYARMTRRQLLYPSALVEGRTAPVLRGRYDADEALARLLAGTGITVRRAGNAFVLAAAPAPRQRPSRPARPAPRAEARPAPAPLAAPVDGPGEMVIVTGSNIRGNRGPSPVIILGREQIEREGHASVAEAIEALPQNFGGTGTEDTLLTGADRTGTNSGASSSANLRGLGSDATLTLVDGRRLPGAGGKGDFSDISLIPFAAVDRIEILPDGASAIYGADAVGGVINVILRRSFSGAETRLRLGTVTEGGRQEVQLGQVAGAQWATGSLLAAYEYERRDNLRAADRSFSRTADLRSRGGDDFRTYYSNPGTIIGPDPVTGALVARYAIPAGQDGTNLTPADFRPGANLQSQVDGTDLLPQQTRHGAFAIVRQHLTPSIEFFAEGRYGHRRFDYAGPASFTVMQVTAANPFFVSPDGSPFSLIAYSFLDDLGPIRNFGTVESWSAAGGLTAGLGGDWSLAAYVDHAEERTRLGIDNIVNASALNEAVGTVPDDPSTPFNAARDGYFNPYGDGAVNSATVLDFIDSGFVDEHLRSTLTSANAKLDGTLFELPGGRVRVAIGGAYRREDFRRTSESFFFGTTPARARPLDAGRSVTAFYGEMVVPLVGPGNARPGVQRLELSAAVRHEHYSDFGSSTNPRFGLIWEPVHGFRLRGSWGTSFRAPVLRELNDPLSVGATQLRDANNVLTAVIFLSGGNPDLEPERARSLTLGAQFEPSGWRGFRGEVTYFQTHFDNRIGQPAFEDLSIVLRDNAFSPFVTPISPATNPADRALVEQLRNTPGSTVPAFVPPELFRAIVDARYVNTARFVVRGVDFLATQNFRLLGGNASLSLNASWLIDYQRQQTPAAPLVERVDTIGNPADLRARLTGLWDRGPIGVTATVNHVDGIRDNVSRPERDVGSWTTVDAQIRYRPGWSGWARDMSFALSVQNLFATDPPFVNRSGGQAYDATNADPLGRFVSLQIIKSW